MAGCAAMKRKPETVAWIDPLHSSGDPFPDDSAALRDPDGLIALGGHLGPDLLLTAYRRGIFPWYNPEEEIQWWTPDPRLVLFPDRVRVSRSLRQTIKNQTFTVTCDRDFAGVIGACAEPRPDDLGTWLSQDMIEAFCGLHELGVAHSVEAWDGESLVGGLYGVTIGRVFFGESMFHRQRDASKVCLVTVCEWFESWGYDLIDCQLHTPHLESMGAEEIHRRRFVSVLRRLCDAKPSPEAWNPG